MAISNQAMEAARERTKQRHATFLNFQKSFYTHIQGMDEEDAHWKAEMDLLDYTKPQPKLGLKAIADDVVAAKMTS